MKAFISYSHKDSSALDRLHTHLAILRREGKIEAWFDRKILPGANIDAEVMSKLQESDLFLALVSPDFLASNYCYETEMKTALKQHESGRTRLIPIILEPCDWQSTPLRSLKALPRDGKPVADWQNENTAYLDVVTELRRIITEELKASKVAQVDVKAKDSQPAMNSSPGGKRYRVKRDFDKIDYSDFRAQVFKTIRDYFEASITEINGIDEIKARFTDINSYSFTCSILNRALKQGAGHITVHAGTGSTGMMGDIYYSLAENAPPNTSNGGFQIEAGDYELYLTARMMLRANDNQRLSATQVAKLMWNELLERAGIAHAEE